MRPNMIRRVSKLETFKRPCLGVAERLRLAREAVEKGLPRETMTIEQLESHPSSLAQRLARARRRYERLVKQQVKE